MSVVGVRSESQYAHQAEELTDLLLQSVSHSYALHTSSFPWPTAACVFFGGVVIDIVIAFFSTPHPGVKSFKRYVLVFKF